MVLNRTKTQAGESPHGAVHSWPVQPLHLVRTNPRVPMRAWRSLRGSCSQYWDHDCYTGLGGQGTRSKRGSPETLPGVSTGVSSIVRGNDARGGVSVQRTVSRRRRRDWTLRGSASSRTESWLGDGAAAAGGVGPHDQGLPALPHPRRELVAQGHSGPCEDLDTFCLSLLERNTSIHGRTVQSARGWWVDDGGGKVRSRVEPAMTSDRPCFEVLDSRDRCRKGASRDTFISPEKDSK